MTLPIRNGGCGLFNYTEIAEIAYLCSRDGLGKGAQKVRTQHYYNTVVEELAKGDVSKSLAKHLKTQATGMAKAWLTADPDINRLQSSQFAMQLLLRLRWQMKSAIPGTLQCGCGFPSKNIGTVTHRDVMIHTLGCVKNGGVSDRHHEIVRFLKQIFEMLGAIVAVEIWLDEKGNRRMDLLVLDHNDVRLWIDVTMATPECRTHKNKTHEQIYKEKRAMKEKTYGEKAKEEGYTLFTFYIDTNGVMDKDSRALLSSLWKRLRNDPTVDRTNEPDYTFTRFLTPLSDLISKGNANCVWKSRLAKQMGIDHSNVGRGHMRKPSPPTSPCDNENDDDDIEAFDTPTNTNNKKTPHRNINTIEQIETDEEDTPKNRGSALEPPKPADKHTRWIPIFGF